MNYRSSGSVIKGKTEICGAVQWKGCNGKVLMWANTRQRDQRKMSVGRQLGNMYLRIV